METSLFELIGTERILPDLQASSKKEVLRELVSAIDTSMDETAIQEIYEVLQEREDLGSTGIGDGIAIPHGKLKNVSKIEICFGRSAAGIPFEAVDGKPAHLFFLMLAPESASGPYLATLARLSRFLKKEGNRIKLANAETKSEIASILSRAD